MDSKRPYRRTHFLINRPLQFRYMVYVLAILLVVMAASVASIYYGIWGSVLRELSNEGIRNKLIIANRIYQYEKVRQGEVDKEAAPMALSFIREVDLLSQREREVFQEILGRTNKRILINCIPLLILIGWGTIFLSHRIAGPLYRFDQCFQTIIKGDLTVRARLRKGDEAIWLSNRFNEMTQSLDHRISNIKRSAHDVLPQIPSSNPAKETLERNLSEFKTSQ
jgi:methyl-accepting chemotaxis protein